MKVRITKVPDKEQDSLNARKWKKADGGYLDIHDGMSNEMLLQAIRKVKSDRGL